MALFLDEDMVGTDANMIAFPHLVLCMGVVVVMGDGSLVGSHFTAPKSEKALLYMMSQKIAQNGSGMDQLYCMADINQHVTQYGGMDIVGKANGLNFTGQGYVIDFGVLKPTDGTYGQLTSNGAGNRATVRCKLNQKMNYTNAATLTSGPAVGIVKISSYKGNQMKSSHSHKIAATALEGSLSTPFLKPATIT